MKMEYLSPIGLAWIAVHLTGLLSTWMVRMTSANRYRAMAEGSFLLSLIIVALTTVVGQFCCLEMWPFSAATLAIMTVMAVIDLGPGSLDVSGQ